MRTSYFFVVVEHVVPLHLPRLAVRRYKKWSRIPRMVDTNTHLRREYTQHINWPLLASPLQHPMTTVINCIAFYLFAPYSGIEISVQKHKVREGDLIPRFECDRVYISNEIFSIYFFYLSFSAPSFLLVAVWFVFLELLIWAAVYFYFISHIYRILINGFIFFFLSIRWIHRTANNKQREQKICAN